MWKSLNKVSGYEDYPYEIDTLGNIRRIGGFYELKKFRKKNNIGFFVTLTRSDYQKRLTCRVSRLICLAHIGPPPSPKARVKYKDSDKENIKLSNLSW